ncbi:alpha carbonic anhydrase 7-like [Magnolia sinica]|uniref:alpha carbonic anhydrase 7-like n=1 Tax=Magnolia sinica TaxID=86752 RepID=UPI002659B97C|nr:alpha carbonic anhydrase 7-like [Magnolia sinica]
MKLNKPIFLSSFLIIFLLNSMLVASQEVENEEEYFNYIEGSDKGPDHWGQIHKDWAACGNGDMQSPIDLLNEKVEVVHHLGRLKRRYKPSNASLVNRGHDIMLKWEYGAGSLFVNGMEYVLRQCHWHSPSEHTVDGQRYNLEVHMVHESLDKKIAVVGIMYKIGRRDKFLTELMDYVRAISNSKDAEKVVGLVNPKHIKLGSRKYYRYMGSLTTPPCTEGVTWTIIKKVRTVSREQVRLFREAVRDDSQMNARPTQDTNNRTVHLYSPRRIHT